MRDISVRRLILAMAVMQAITMLACIFTAYRSASIKVYRDGSVSAEVSGEVTVSGGKINIIGR